MLKSREFFLLSPLLVSLIYLLSITKLEIWILHMPQGRPVRFFKEVWANSLFFIFFCEQSWEVEWRGTQEGSCINQCEGASAQSWWDGEKARNAWRQDQMDEPHCKIVLREGGPQVKTGFKWRRWRPVLHPFNTYAQGELEQASNDHGQWHWTQSPKH